MKGDTIGHGVRDDGPRSHVARTGSPTMGDALSLWSICVTTLLWEDQLHHFLWVVLLVTLAFDAIG